MVLQDGAFFAECFQFSGLQVRRVGRFQGGDDFLHQRTFSLVQFKFHGKLRKNRTLNRKGLDEATFKIGLDDFQIVRKLSLKRDNRQAIRRLDVKHTGGAVVVGRLQRSDKQLYLFLGEFGRQSDTNFVVTARCGSNDFNSGQIPIRLEGLLQKKPKVDEAQAFERCVRPGQLLL